MKLYTEESRLWDELYLSLIVSGKRPHEALSTCDEAIMARRHHRGDVEQWVSASEHNEFIIGNLADTRRTR